MERRLGNIFGFDGGNYAGNVYDKNYMCPTLNTMQGGCKQPMIIEDKKIEVLGNYQPGEHDASRVVNANGLAPKVKENHGTVTATIVAMRGRNPDNPFDRTPGIPTEQRLEPNSQGICNTLTSVQKDNLVLENVYDFYNDKLKDDGVCGIITGACSQNGSGTFGVVEESILQIPRGYNKGGEHSICPPITSHSFQENNLLNQQYRIRKLTPLECWRLMDFSDEDFHKAEKVNSNTQLYKQAGNSIVKNVLVAIFGQMIPGKENVYEEIN